MAEARLDGAVGRIRPSRGYRASVWAYRCLAVGLVLGLLVLASAPLRFLPLTIMLFAVAAMAIAAGVTLGWIGMLMLRADRLMPRGGTNRHRAMMRRLWRDVIRPVARERRG